MNRFQKLSIATTAMTMFLIGVGGTVRGTGSGLGCPDWPRCHGKWYPPLNFHSIVEYSHRSSASIVIVLVLATAAYAWMRYRSVATIFWPAFSALIVIGFQAFLGELVVKSKLNPHLVVVHFATSLALLALVTLTTVNSFRPRGGRFGSLAKEAAGVAAGTALVAILGAYVTQWNAALVFADWPLFDGKVIPAMGGHPGAGIQFIHRLAAALLGVAIAHLAWRLTKARARTALRVLVWVAAGTYLLQVVAGAAQIWSKLAAWAVAAHVLGGGGLWGATVALAFASYRLTAEGAGARASRSAASGHTERPGSHIAARVRAYFMLTKPRVVELLLITTVPAMVVAARGWPSIGLILATLVGGSLAAGGAGALNCFVDRDIDDVMERTHGRPVPAGAIEPPRALVFGIVLEVISFAFLAATVNVLAASLAVGATVFYVFVYTMWLKRATPSNIVIGGAAGAAPVLVGWAAVTGHVGMPAVVMFAVIFYWTPPHFWALSMRYTEDYAAAKVPMLPVVRGAEATARHIVLYTVSLAGISLVLYPVGRMGPLYLVSALVLGGLFVQRALVLQKKPADPREAMRLFHFSIAYLSLLFVAMAADRLVGGGTDAAVQAAAYVVGVAAFAISQAAIGYAALRWRRAEGGVSLAAAFLGKKASPSRP